jgi:hypothetical protein
MAARQIAPSPPGWYFVRVDGSGQMVRFPVAAWWVGERGSGVLIAKPGEPGPVDPAPDDIAGLVGLVPPDREYQSYFASEDIQAACARLFRHEQPEAYRRHQQATVREVDMPGVGPVSVTDGAAVNVDQTWARNLTEQFRRTQGPRLVPPLPGER